MEAVDYADVAVSLELADALLGAENWQESEEIFKRVAEDLQRRLTAGEDVNELIESPLEPIYLGVALCWARLGIAANYLERTICLELAVESVKLARESLEKLDDKAKREAWQGNCDRLEGEAFYQLDRIDEATARLERSIAVTPSAVDYYYLALCLERRIELGESERNFAPTRRQAELALNRARQLDFTNEFATKLDVLETRVQSLGAQPEKA